MIPIHGLINKIKWDPYEVPEKYSFHYYDRIEQKLIEFKYTEIQEIADGFINLWKNDKMISIPFHRIKRVTMDGTVAWQRPHP